MTHEEHEKVKLAKLLGMWVHDGTEDDDTGCRWWCHIGDSSFVIPWADYDWRDGDQARQEAYELYAAEMVLAELGKLLGERLGAN